jgi:hypothetical protein
VISPFSPLVDLVFLVLAFVGSWLLSCHFWPFTEVLGRIWRFVTRKDAINRVCFADPVQHEVLADLTEIADLKVSAARPCCRTKRDNPRNLREIAQQLGGARDDGVYRCD